MKLDIETLDFPMAIDNGALNALPPPAQYFIKEVLSHQYGKTNGWCWHTVDRVFGPDKPYVQLCSIGSPPRDTSYVWVYNTDALQYQLYQTQYHDPISLLVGQSPEDTADTFHGLLSRLKPSYTIHGSTLGVPQTVQRSDGTVRNWLDLL